MNGFIQWTLQNPHPQSFIGFKNQLHAVINHDVSAELHKITAPTLVIAGEEDMLMPAKQLKMLSKILKKSTFMCIADCAHMPHVEKSAEFAEGVIRHLHPSRQMT
ncbi:MAG: alpha/beta hydrolase fold protein [uncultured bacterium]|nr:MAG: alpha/beta hydrolase fold protein [uncultured bacterium]